MTTAGLEPATFWYPYMGNIRQSKPNALPLRQVVVLCWENIYNMYLYNRSLILAIDLLVVLLSDVLLFTIFVGFSSWYNPLTWRLLSQKKWLRWRILSLCAPISSGIFIFIFGSTALIRASVIHGLGISSKRNSWLLFKNRRMNVVPHINSRSSNHDVYCL